jgi:hypothetical protein
MSYDRHVHSQWDGLGLDDKFVVIDYNKEREISNE